MHDKHLPLALRPDRNPPSLQAMNLSTICRIDSGAGTRYGALSHMPAVCSTSAT